MLGASLVAGWIKVEKDLVDDPRVRRMARELCNAHVTQARSRIIGAVVILWVYADTHVRDDDTLEIGADEINELVGIDGFAQIMPADWLEILDANNVKLPGFHAHNGTHAKKKALTAKRVAKHREKSVTQPRSKRVTSSVTRALPDQDLDLDRERDLRSSSVGDLSPSRSLGVQGDKTADSRATESRDETEAAQQGRAALRAVVAKLSVTA